MRIEIDTSSATKEELAHLAEMLRSLSGSQLSSPSSAPVGSAVPGYVNIFGDSPSPSSTPSAPPQDSGSGGLFSIFGDSPQQSTSPSQPSAYSQQSEDTFVIPKKSSGKDILDDDRIQLY
jgi:hypothetical protein